MTTTTKALQQTFDLLVAAYDTATDAGKDDLAEVVATLAMEVEDELDFGPPDPEHLDGKLVAVDPTGQTGTGWPT